MAFQCRFAVTPADTRKREIVWELARQGSPPGVEGENEEVDWEGRALCVYHGA
jgi:hypothetical protein